MEVSVILPVLNEAPRLGSVLAELRANHPGWEMLVVDGGSRDGSAEIAEEAGADRVLRVRPGRGMQLQAGGNAATSEVLLFLHADCLLPEDAADWIEDTVRDERWSGGAFRVRHHADRQTGWWTKRLIRIADWRSRYTRFPYGDQGVFTSKKNFERIDGFPEQPLMEDFEFARRLHKLGPIRRIPAEIRASARRFERRPWRTFVCWNLFPTLYRLGVSSDRLARWYHPRTGEPSC